MTSTESPTAPVPERSRPPRRSRLRTRLTAGLVLILPIWITYLLVAFVFRLMRDASLWIVEALIVSPWVARVLESVGVSADALHSQGLDALPPALRWILAGTSVLLTFGLVYSLGVITTNLVGRRIVRMIELIMGRVPFVKTVYHACKQVMEAFAGESTQSYQRVVTVPFPGKRLRTVGFVTRVTQDPVTKEEVCAIFVPTTPNPTTGFLLMIPRTDLVDVDWTVEEAVAIIMSGGVILPATIQLVPALTDAQPESPAKSV